MKKQDFFRTFLFYFLQWTWGLPQNLLGFFIFLFLRLRHAPLFSYHHAIVTFWGKGRGSMSLGMFLFLGTAPEDTHAKQVLCHEFGHTLQSFILGPFFLLIIGLPSLLWASLPFFERMRRKKHISYYKMYQEAWANRLGTKQLKEQAPE